MRGYAENDRFSATRGTIYGQKANIKNLWPMNDEMEVDLRTPSDLHVTWNSEQELLSSPTPNLTNKPRSLGGAARKWQNEEDFRLVGST